MRRYVRSYIIILVNRSLCSDRKNWTGAGRIHERKEEISTMKKLITILVVILTMFCTTAFASAATDPAVTIVNPANESMVYSDSLLVSVKVTQPKTIRVSVSEKRQTVNGVDVSIDVNKLTSESAEIGADILKNAKNVQISDSEKFTCSNNLSFYTKQINNLNPGVYQIQVDTLNSAGESINSSTSLVAMMGKQSAEDQSKIIDTTQNNGIGKLFELIKGLFK